MSQHCEADYNLAGPEKIEDEGMCEFMVHGGLGMDEARLQLLREVSGTSTYDSRRDESMQIMAEAQKQKRRITDNLTTIEGRLKALDAEKAELAKYRSLEKQRR